MESAVVDQLNIDELKQMYAVKQDLQAQVSDSSQMQLVDKQNFALAEKIREFSAQSSNFDRLEAEIALLQAAADDPAKTEESRQKALSMIEKAGGALKVLKMSEYLDDYMPIIRNAPFDKSGLPKDELRMFITAHKTYLKKNIESFSCTLSAKAVYEARFFNLTTLEDSYLAIQKNRMKEHNRRLRG